MGRRAKNSNSKHPTGYIWAESISSVGFVRVEEFSAWWHGEDRFDVLLMERQNDVPRFKLLGSTHTLTHWRIEEYTVSQTSLEQIFNSFHMATQQALEEHARVKAQAAEDRQAMKANIAQAIALLTQAASSSAPFAPPSTDCQQN
ncbi:unnamed protein product [Aphanomyces euteiches]